MAAESAGLLLYRSREGRLEVLLAHPGGPFWKRKDEGAWTIPKGQPDPGEALVDAAVREFREETGGEPAPPYLSLGTVRQAGGKRVHGFAAQGEFDPATIRSNTFELEWPPRSGNRQTFPEVDRVAWFGLAEARVKMNKGQVPLLDALQDLVGAAGEGAGGQAS